MGKDTPLGKRGRGWEEGRENEGAASSLLFFFYILYTDVPPVTICRFRST